MRRRRPRPGAAAPPGARRLAAGPGGRCGRGSGGGRRARAEEHHETRAGERHEARAGGGGAHRPGGDRSRRPGRLHRPRPRAGPRHPDRGHRPSGCGKTTLLRSLAGLHRPEAGSVLLGGEPLAPTYRRRSREQRRRIQLVPQNPLGALNPARTVGATLARPLKLHFGTPADRCEERVAELLTSVGLTPEHAHRHPRELSGGQRQRVSVARALAAEPDVLLCDEITSALDAGTAEGIMALLRELRDDRGLAIVLVSHDLPLVSAHADTVLPLGRPGPEPHGRRDPAAAPVPTVPDRA
ncbi:ATP-binding cassette domain-containing protein [Kitasatospora purpeofusca]|uniref:ATP-binding cassette domain-containing protein n=1 Tax=Kitasatospora purpeofusca TaxID=67352 RepID=UPI00365D8D25